jgi:hypothetical protein
MKVVAKISITLMCCALLAAAALGTSASAGHHDGDKRDSLLAEALAKSLATAEAPTPQSDACGEWTPGSATPLLPDALFAASAESGLELAGFTTVNCADEPFDPTCDPGAPRTCQDACDQQLTLCTNACRAGLRINGRMCFTECTAAWNNCRHQCLTTT